MRRDELVDGAWYLINPKNRPYGLKYQFAQYHHGQFHFEIGSYQPHTMNDCEWARINPEEIFNESL